MSNSELPCPLRRQTDVGCLNVCLCCHSPALGGGMLMWRGGAGGKHALCARPHAAARSQGHCQ